MSRAQEMRRLSDEDRDRLIEAAGDLVLDARSRFIEKQKQVALRGAYRKPKKPEGAA